MNPKPNKPPTGAPTATPQAAGAAWLSVADAAALLGISARAVQKRADRGTLPARRVKYGDAVRWEINARELDARAGAKGSQDVRLMGAKRSLDGRKADTEQAAFEREPVRAMGAKGSQDVRKTFAGGAAPLAEREPTRREVEQQEEIRFLRATVEQLQRDGAETRAALRAALKLTAGTSAPQLTAGTLDGADVGAASGDVAGDVAASAGRSTAPEREQFGPLDVPTAKQPRAAPITYDSIADELERNLKARGL